MATYIHSKMTTNANKGHRVFGSARSTKSNRNGGKGHVRFIDSLRTRWRQWDDADTVASIDVTATALPDDGETLSITFGEGNTAQVITFTTGGGANETSFTSNTATLYRGTVAGHSDGIAQGVADGIKVLANSVSGYTATRSGAVVTIVQDSGSSTGDIVVTSGTSAVTAGELREGQGSYLAKGIQVAKRLFEPNLSFGGSKGTTYKGTTIGRTNTSAGTKDVIRDSAA